MKVYKVFGIQLTSLELMRFNKYLDNNNIKMNTKHSEERTQIVSNWLKENK